MNFKSSSWDTCAPEAVLSAAGGRLTDIFGEAIAHVPDPADPAGVGYLNALGAVASGPGFSFIHQNVGEAMVRDAGALKKLEPWGIRSNAWVEVTHCPVGACVEINQ